MEVKILRIGNSPIIIENWPYQDPGANPISRGSLRYCKQGMQVTRVAQVTQES
jgi:hypothetical protein